MALETLKDIKQLGGFDVSHTGIESPVLAEAGFIEVNHADNMVTFKIQAGPVKEAGLNGCQVETLVHTAVAMLEGLDKKFHSKYNTATLSLLKEALNYQKLRREEREARGVEGTSQA